MENPSDIDTYGGRFSNAAPVEDPTTQLEASYYEQLINDAAQMSRTSAKVIVIFPTVASGTSTPLATKSQWGSGAAYYPTSITRTGVGTYELVYPATFANELGVDENVTFWISTGHVLSVAVFGLVQCTASGASIVAKTYDSTHAAADLTAGTPIGIFGW